MPYPVLPNSSCDRITSQKPQQCTGTTMEEIVWYSHHAIVCSWPSGLRNVAAKVKIQVSELCGMQTRVHQILTWQHVTRGLLEVTLHSHILRISNWLYHCVLCLHPCDWGTQILTRICFGKKKLKCQEEWFGLPLLVCKGGCHFKNINASSNTFT